MIAKTWAGPIEYYEAPPSPRESCDRDGNIEAVRLFDVNWGDRWILIQYLLGQTNLKFRNGGYYIERFPPKVYNYSPEDVDDVNQDIYQRPNSTGPGQYTRAKIYATNIQQIENLGPRTSAVLSTQRIWYDVARIAVHYTRRIYHIMRDYDEPSLQAEINGLDLPVDANGNPSDIIRSMDSPGQKETWLWRAYTAWFLPATKMQEVPFTKFSYVPNLGSPNIPVLEKLDSGEVIYNWYHVPVALQQDKRIARYLGTVNKYTFDGYPHNCLRFDGFAYHDYKNYDGTLLRDYQLYFNFLTHKKNNGLPYGGDIRNFVSNEMGSDGRIDRRGHNFYPRKDGDDINFVPLVTASTGKTLYPLRDWAGIFRPYDIDPDS